MTVDPVDPVDPVEPEEPDEAVEAVLEPVPAEALAVPAATVVLAPELVVGVVALLSFCWVNGSRPEPSSAAWTAASWTVMAAPVWASATGVPIAEPDGAGAGAGLLDSTTGTATIAASSRTATGQSLRSRRSDRSAFR